MTSHAMLSACLVAAVTLAVSFAGCGPSGSSDAASLAGTRCEHEIKAETCPFCNPDIIEAEGFCGEHGFPEALCAKCRPGIKVAFRARGDWCEEHKLPESQCIACDPALAENIRPGVHGGAMPGTRDDAHCEHGKPVSECTLCTP